MINCIQQTNEWEIKLKDVFKESLGWWDLDSGS